MIISFLLTQFTFVNYVLLITINGNGCNHTMSKQSKNKFNRNSSLDTIHNSSRNNNGMVEEKKVISNVRSIVSTTTTVF